MWAQKAANPKALLQNGVIQVVTSVATLRTIPPNTKRNIRTSGVSAVGDGGGGDWYAVIGAAPGTYIDNKGIVVVPAGGDGSSAWLRDYSGRISVDWFDAGKGGVVSAEVQAAVDYLETLGGGGIDFPSDAYEFTGVTVTKPISLHGNIANETNFINSAAAGRMLDYQYSGVADVDKRIYIRVEDIRFTDDPAGMGTGFYSNLFLFIELNRCLFEGFDAGYGINIEEGLWVGLNNVNTDSANIRIKSVLDPHWNNVISINGGELRNPTTYALECELADVVLLNGVTIEGDSGGTTAPVRGASFKGVSMLKIDGLYAEFLRTGDSVLKLDDCRAVKICRSNIGSGDNDVPSIWLHDTNDVEISECVLNWMPLKTTGDTFGVKVRSELWGLLDIADGNGVVFEDCAPNNTATAIPVDPRFQSETYEGQGVPFKNWYSSSSFEFRDPTIDTSGTATMTYDNTVGYHDLNSLKVAAVGVQTCVFANMGVTDNLNDGAIISFMAKADIEVEVTCQGSISATLGTTRLKMTPSWKRYFVFTQLSTAAAGTGISAIFTTTETCDFWIDDIQTVAYQSYKEAGYLFSNFRHVPTHGVKVTALEDKNRSNHKKHFDRGINLRVMTAAPDDPGDGDIYYADGVGWNPGSGAGFYGYQSGAYVKL